MQNESTNNPKSDQLDEELVAYLDGELEPQSTQQLENLLAGDEQARRRLSQLAASWDLLDQLPRANVDDLFTRTTVEMVALAAEDEIAQLQVAAPAKRRRHWIEGALATVAAAAIGFVVVTAALPNQNDSLVRDLPLLMDLDLYRVAGEVDFLKKLQTAGFFTDDATESRSSVCPARYIAGSTPPL